jgi:uncharacterized membrane protein
MSNDAPAYATTMIHETIEWTALGIEVLAVAVILVAVLALAFKRGTVRYLFHLGRPGALESYRYQLGKGLLLGLELLVAADVIRTVAVKATLENVSVLTLLVVARTILSWSLVIETEGRWPWQACSRAASPAHAEKPD